MLRYKTKTRPGLVALYDIRPGNGAGPFLQPRSPHGAVSPWNVLIVIYAWWSQSEINGASKLKDHMAWYKFIFIVAVIINNNKERSHVNCFTVYSIFDGCECIQAYFIIEYHITLCGSLLLWWLTTVRTWIHTGLMCLWDVDDDTWTWLLIEHFVRGWFVAYTAVDDYLWVIPKWASQWNF